MTYGPRDFKANDKVTIGGVGPFDLGEYYDPSDYAECENPDCFGAGSGCQGNKWSEWTELEVFLLGEDGMGFKEIYLYGDDIKRMAPWRGVSTSEVDEVPGHWVVANTSNVRGLLVFVPDDDDDIVEFTTVYTKRIPHDHDWRVNNGTIVCVSPGCKDKKKRTVDGFNPKDKTTWTPFTGDVHDAV